MELKGPGEPGLLRFLWTRAPARRSEVWQALAVTCGIAQCLVLAKTLDSALTVRLREVVAGGSVTESALRELSEQADDWASSLEAQIWAGERMLAHLTADPARSMTEIAEELRRVKALRPALVEVRRLRAMLDVRARELRATWVRAGL
jgi:hypothetical protein